MDGLSDIFQSAKAGLDLSDEECLSDYLSIVESEFPCPHMPAFCMFGAETAYGGFAQGGVGSTAVAASALRQVAKEQGYPLSDAVLRMLLGHAAFESGYGRGDPTKNTLANTNNWGSVQATRQYFVQPNLGKSGFGAVAHQDSDPKHSSAANPGGTFIGWYAVFPNAVEGARAFFNTVKPAITPDIDQYAANLYHRSYYSGTTTDPQKAIAAYAKAIRGAMPVSVPADTQASIAEAQRFSVGPFAPVFNRMTANDKVNGRVKWPATAESAKAAWDKSWSSPAAYGLNLLGKVIDLPSVLATDGVVWLGPTPPGFGGGVGGALVAGAALERALMPVGGALLGMLLGGFGGLPGVLLGGILGGGIGYGVSRLGIGPGATQATHGGAPGGAPAAFQAPAAWAPPTGAPVAAPAAPKAAVQALAATASAALYTLGWQNPATQAAVKAWQVAHGGLDTDGHYGPASQKAMAIDLAPAAAPAAFTKGAVG
jgi:hypothetical protein